MARRFPCDDVVTSPAIELWRGVTVLAPPERTWPRVRQLRVAPYSYDWLDNGGRRSPRALLDVPEPSAGEPFSCMAGTFDVGEVVAAQAGTHLTARVMGALMSYVLVPEGATTRLLLKVVLPDHRWYGRALALGDWPMARKQLLTLKQLAEADAGDGRSSPGR